MNRLLLFLGAVAFLFLEASSGAAEELKGMVAVSGGKVEIHVQNKDGSPAAGINVRLILGRQLTAAVARTDEHGRWVHRLEQTGDYEALVEDGAELLRLPFLVLNEPRAQIPWFIVSPFVLCACGALALLILGTRSLPQAGSGSGPGRGFLLLMAGLLAVSASVLAWCAWHEWNKRASEIGSAHNLAKEAREFLRKREVAPLSDSLVQLLTDKTDLIKTMPHPLLGKSAPDFEVFDHRQKPWQLSKLLAKGPVVLVFYYGYHCNHCVGQLFALNDDVEKFRELGAQVVTMSADPAKLTRDRFRQYGEFAFPVLSDPGNKMAHVYGAYRPASEKTPENLEHATFVIGRDGIIRWAHHGDSPFTDNRTLLHELARLEGRLTGG